MKENPYDNAVFFQKYSQMDRSKKGLGAAGEWQTLKGVLPDFTAKRVLDLGCGYGWHCEYAAQHGAAQVTGVDLSKRMLEVAQAQHSAPQVTYLRQAIEDVSFADASFDIVLSSLALHYVADYAAVVRSVRRMLSPGGWFVFSAEHPVFTAQGSQDWVYGEDGAIDHFPVDNYYIEGKRQAVFLGETVTKYHRTLTTYLETLLLNGFALRHVKEPQPPQEMIETTPGMADELRRPMMLIVAAQKM